MNSKLSFDVIQIQTIDSCNARCITCPHPQIYHTNKLMDEDLFQKIILDIKDNVSFTGVFNQGIHLYLQNEPLVDHTLFDRVDFVYNTTGQMVFLISNGLLLPKLHKQIMEHPIKMNISLYYENMEDFNTFHGVNASQAFIDNIASLHNGNNINIIKSFFNHSIEEIKSGENLKIFSRCGFLNGGKILHDKVGGCKRNRHDRRLHILHDGNVVLCCNDFIKEVILGNLNHQTIREVVESDLYKTIINKVNGNIESETNFVCKRCEEAIKKD